MDDTKNCPCSERLSYVRECCKVSIVGCSLNSVDVMDLVIVTFHEIEAFLCIKDNAEL